MKTPTRVPTNAAIVAMLADEPICRPCDGTGRDRLAPRNACGHCRGLGVPTTSAQGREILWAKAQEAAAAPRWTF